MSPDIDEKAFLAGVAELERLAGDWREHLPYKAACQFAEIAEVRSLYDAHVSGCEYCRELIDLFSKRGAPAQTPGDDL